MDNLPDKPRNGRGRIYSVEEIDRGLTALALYGSYRAAARMLHEMGDAIPEETLRTWETSKAARLQEIRETYAPQIAEKIAAQAEAFILHATEVEADLLKDLHAKRDKLNAGELAGALRNVTTSKSLNLDKIASPLRGRPSRVIEARSSEEIMRSLAQRVPGLRQGIDAESTAQEIAHHAPTAQEIPQ